MWLEELRYIGGERVVEFFLGERLRAGTMTDGGALRNPADCLRRCTFGGVSSTTIVRAAPAIEWRSGIHLSKFINFLRAMLFSSAACFAINEDTYAALIDQLEDKETRLDWIDDDQGDYGEWSQSDEDSAEHGYDAAAEAREKARDAFGNIDFKRLNGGRKRASAANDSEEKGAPSPERKRARAALAVATVCLHTAEAWWNTRGLWGHSSL